MLEGGERTILNYKGTMPNSKDHELDLSIIEKGEWIDISSLGDMDLLERIITRAAKHNVRVMLNPAGVELKQTDKLKALLDDVHVLAVNKEEAQMIVHGETSEELIRHLTALCTSCYCARWSKWGSCNRFKNNCIGWNVRRCSCY